jgi:2-oxoglutarate dehydrogenase E2 component (dihydrolipoamide succinyltransferase)
MALVEMVMPKMGESIMEGTILNWLKKVGDRIEQDESVLEVATDKVDTEVPATHAGVLKEILAKEGEVVAVGKPIAVIATEGESGDTVAPVAALEQEIKKAVEEVVQPTPVQVMASATVPAPVAVSTGRFYSPLVLNIAKQEGIAMSELETIPGTGQEGRVTKKDILSYVAGRKNGTHAPMAQPSAAPAVPSVAPVAALATSMQSSAPAPTAAPSVSFSGKADIIEMDRMRKMIAQRMVDSKRISPHVTSFVEADVTNLVLWRNQVKDAFKKREGENLTFTPVFIQAIVKAIKDFPMINISVDGDHIIVKKDINIGMAVALPSGNLIVPVIKQADTLNLVGLSKKVNDLANRARLNKLTPDDLSDGTFTISNVGSFGNVMGTPIIVQPQVGIIATGSINKKPAVLETPTGDVIAIRHMMFLSHSYDHRVVDGALGGSFVRRVADYLEQFDLKTEI